MNNTERALGVLLLDTTFPRIPGDVGNPASYDFPVILRTVKGATVQKVVYEADDALISDFIREAKILQDQGVFAITTSCGYLARFQNRIAEELAVPIFTSSLMQVRMAYHMTGKKVAIVTANSNKLTHEILNAVEIDDSFPWVLQGLQELPAFSNTFLKDQQRIDSEEITKGILAVTESLVSAHPNIGSFVFECHNLAPYSAAVQQKFGIPVFDIIDFAYWVHSSVSKRAYNSDI